MMKGEQKSHKEVGHWPYLAIVAIVAVVAVVFLVIKGVDLSGGSDTTSETEGALVGESFLGLPGIPSALNSHTLTVENTNGMSLFNLCIDLDPLNNVYNRGQLLLACGFNGSKSNNARFVNYTFQSLTTIPDGFCLFSEDIDGRLKRTNYLAKDSCGDSADRNPAYHKCLNGCSKGACKRGPAIAVTADFLESLEPGLSRNYINE